MKLAKGKPKRRIYVCQSGPWADQRVLMPSETMVLTVGTYKGYYYSGKWINVR